MTLFARQLFLLCALWIVTGAFCHCNAAAAPDLPFQPSNRETSRIGILLPDRSEPLVIQAAALAVEQANARSGNRYQYELMVRTTEGPWGAGSKESVALVYEDSVDVIVGSLDGRNAHLAEQVTAKSHLVYLETRATDPTLSQAFVPWFMRCVPGDDQQSQAILQQIGKDSSARIAILSNGDYDTRYSVRSLIKTVAGEMGVSPFMVNWEAEGEGTSPSAGQLKEKGITHLIVPFFDPDLPEWLSAARTLIPDLRICGNLSFALGLENAGLLDHARGEAAGQPHFLEGAVMVCSGSRFSMPGKQFREQFRARYGTSPGMRCSYMYDAVTLAIQGLEQPGANRDSLKDILSGMRYSEGVTGVLSFDQWGDREQQVPLMTIRQGEPSLQDY